MVGPQASEIVGKVNDWAAAHFRKKKIHHDRWTNIEYGYWRAPDRETHGEWQLHYISSPFDEQSHLLVVKLQHIPMVGRKGTLDEWLEEIHHLLTPQAKLALIEDHITDFSDSEISDAPNA